MSKNATGPGPCPYCGSDTVLRTNRRLGVPFYGCSRFPNCKGTRDYEGIDDDYDDLENDSAQGANMSVSMNNLNNKLMDRFFKRVDGVVWDLMTGKVGIMGADGISSLEGEGDEAQINLNMMDQFGMPVPAFAQSTNIDQVKMGDLIYVNGKPKGWVIEVIEPKKKPASKTVSKTEEPKVVLKKFRVMSPNGSSGVWTPPKVSMFGFDSGVMVLKSLAEMLPGGSDGLTGMQGMLMPLMMMGDGDMGDVGKIMPMLLMSQMGMGGASAGAGAGANNMIQTMMLMKMMGGKSSNKGGGFGSFFD